MATDVERLAVLFEANTKQFSNAMLKLQQDTNRALKGATTSVKSLDNQLKTIGATAKTVGNILGISLGIGLARQIGVAIGDIIKDVSELVNTADKLGITTKQLQELKFAAGQTGVDFDELTGALSFFNKAIGEASRGGGDLLAILNANNVAIRDQAGNLLPPMELLARYADLVKNAANAQDQATLVTKAFGKSSDELINTLSGGAQGLRDYAAQAQQTGQIIDDELARKGEKLGNIWAQMTGQMEVATHTLALSVISDLLDWGKAIDDFIENLARKMGLRGLDARFQGFGEGGNGTASTSAVLDAFQRANPTAVVNTPPKTILPELPQAKAKVDEVSQAVKDLIDELDKGREAAKGFLSTFIDGMLKGESLTESLGDALKNLAKKIIDSGLDQLVASLFGPMGSATGGILSSIFAGFLAGGGSIGAGQFAIAGEKGPEIVTGPATVTPMAANMNRPTVIELHVVRGEMFEARVAQVSGPQTVRIIGAHDKGMQRRQQAAG